jgi:hypothetical protein
VVRAEGQNRDREQTRGYLHVVVVVVFFFFVFSFFAVVLRSFTASLLRLA